MLSSVLRIFSKIAAYTRLVFKLMKLLISPPKNFTYARLPFSQRFCASSSYANKALNARSIASLSGIYCSTSSDSFSFFPNRSSPFINNIFLSNNHLTQSLKILEIKNLTILIELNAPPVKMSGKTLPISFPT